MRNSTHVLWFCIFFVHALLLALIYPDSYQQDGGYRYLMCRWSWLYPDYLVSPWARPLFTTLYSLPAQLGYLPARMVTPLLLFASGYVSCLVGRHFGLKKLWLLYPLLLLQPRVLLLSFDTMTEPLFGLIFLLAILLYLKKRPFSAALLVSLLPLIRPEGFFVGIFWGFVILFDARIDKKFWMRFPKSLLLLAGSILWWLSAWAITGNFFWILDTWPWKGQGKYASAQLEWYGRVGFEIAGPIFFLFLAGMVLELKKRLWILPMTAIYFFFFQIILWEFGLFGSAGYARYFVCISPVIALLALSALNQIELRIRFPRLLSSAVATFLLVSWGFALYMIDCHKYLHDSRAVEATYNWYQENDGRPVKRLFWSQAYMCILFDADLRKTQLVSGKNPDEYREEMRQAPEGSLIFWDTNTGPDWYGLGPLDFEKAGYTKLRSKRYRLQGHWSRHVIFGHCGTREQEMHLYYKE